MVPGGSGNAGVANIVKTTPYAIGYVELAYVFQNKMAYAFVQNADGNSFVEPTLDTVAADAAAAGGNLPAADGDWSQVSIVNQPGSNSYPISTLTYIMVYKDLSTVTGETQDKANEVLNFLNYVIHDGQQYSAGLLYVPLPDPIKKIDEAGLAQVTFNGGAVPEFGPIAGSGSCNCNYIHNCSFTKTGLKFSPKF